jgi:predicted phage terminase large subunit-like protein
VLGVDTAGDPWLLDLWRKQASSDEWVESFCDLVIKWQAERMGRGAGSDQVGRRPVPDAHHARAAGHVVREAFPTRGDKAVRAQSFRALIATRGLRVPKDAPWAVDLTAELLRFPAGVNDDQVDALGLVGQLLDKISRGAKLPPPPKPKKDTSYRWRTERDDAPSLVTL